MVFIPFITTHKKYNPMDYDCFPITILKENIIITFLVIIRNAIIWNDIVFINDVFLLYLIFILLSLLDME